MKTVYAIGGVGGSGTRVVAELFKKLGYFMGDDLNESNDNLLFTLLFKRENILTATNEEFEALLRIFLKHNTLGESLSKEEHTLVKFLASKERTLHTKEWLQERLSPLARSYQHTLWGFKEPNSHIVIERLFEYIPELKFIYVYRDGRDMAYSSNQNQLTLWGPIFANSKEFEPNVKNSLKYWVGAHTRMMQLSGSYADKILMLDFDKLCLDPESQLSKIATFMNKDKEVLLKHRELIKAPSSIGRHKQYSLNDFDPDDLEKIEEIYGSPQ
ncbi:MAG: sulfotransferase [Helicobacteraceae bacterium]|nr:sulfotransferase [Helicobacteraceae bacterium]